ncbi:hypothetical protein BDK51DRAFT_49781 [Blyttiomyces helicus]|uniref:Uncharacterized protein n=1 Tax=Blyttiomyces helicus TaxID=388810 RepID=A0A4P9VWT9_9FUNG|nr:hypothetical protein BDK51DRAFT_49781 [Blyttiomyces helicus]|eukprot:RKO83662.1 hypothetical protein BDK51DRAFT_49781 [Blyttiomyces helicus]
MSTPEPTKEQQQHAAHTRRAVPTATLDYDHTVTRIHYPRLFLYITLFLLPYILSVASLASHSIYHEPVNPTMPQMFPDTNLGYWRVCPGANSCIDYNTYCDIVSRVNAAAFPSPPPVFDGFCNANFKAARGLATTAVILGFFVFLALVDNILVWRGASFWYHPSRHTVSDVREVRHAFKEIILTCAILHILAQTIALGLLGSSSALGPGGPDVGLWLGVASLAFSATWVICFFFFDKKTFFHLPVGSNQDIDA